MKVHPTTAIGINHFRLDHRFLGIAIARREEYAKSEYPHVPVTHGPGFTRLQYCSIHPVVCGVTLYLI